MSLRNIVRRPAALLAVLSLLALAAPGLAASPRSSRLSRTAAAPPARTAWATLVDEVGRLLERLQPGSRGGDGSGLHSVSAGEGPSLDPHGNTNSGTSGAVANPLPTGGGF